MDAKAIKEQAELEFAEEQIRNAKEKLKVLLRKQAAAKTILSNIEKEIADAYVELG
jgi:hypothetical protein